MKNAVKLGVLVGVLVLGACSDDAPVGGPAGAADGAPVDSHMFDASIVDAAVTDVSAPVDATTLELGEDVPPVVSDMPGSDVPVVEPDVPVVEPDVPAVEPDVVDPDVPGVEPDVVEPDVPAVEPDGGPAIDIAVDAGPCTGAQCPCVDDADCEDDNPCTKATCGDDQLCKITPLDGASCEADDNVCTAGDSCKDAKCEPGPVKICDDGNSCTLDGCDPAAGCTATADEGASCDDDNPCSTGDSCSGGTCLAGAAKSCDSGKDCVTGECSLVSGKCEFNNAPAGTGCDDGSQCSTADSCVGGQCTGKTIDCDDKNLCTNDTCKAASGCTHEAKTGACDDGDSCTEKDACAKGKCAGTALICDDGNPCTTDSCDPKAGCTFGPNDKPCVGPDPCIGGTTCKNGKCQGGQKKDCDDKDPCTTDSCEAKLGCQHSFGGASAGKPCDDGDACTKKDICDAKAGKCVGVAPVCDAGTPCLKGACDPKVGNCIFTANDGVGCNADDTACTVDTCKTGKCLAGPKKDCSTGNVCVVGTCADKTGKCAFQSQDGAPCDDGDACTAPDICKGTDCAAGTAKTCDDGSACTTDKCDKATGKCVFTPLKEGDACDSAPCQDKQTCKAGKCQGGQPKSCDDADKCTIDSCDAKSGVCAHKVDDSNPACCNKQPWLEDFEQELKGWKADAPVQGLAWSRYTFKTPGYAKSGKSGLKLGAPNAETFSGFTSGSTFMWINGGSVTLKADKQATLTMDVKIDAGGTYASYHRLYVYAVYKGRNLLLSTVYGQLGEWQTVTRDVTALAGKTFTLRIGGRLYGTAAAPVSGVGITIDDMRFTTTCKAKACAADSACPTLTCLAGSCLKGTCAYADNCCQTTMDCKADLCTTPTCSFYTCQYSKKPNCCMTQPDCDDSNPCTIDACPAAGGPCKHTEIAGCCLSDGQCDDGNACTVDSCKGDKCSHANACCKDASDCDDGDDKCTTDSCESGKCEHAPTGAAGCCKPEVAAWHFNDAGQGDGFAFAKCNPGNAYYLPSGCQSVSGKSPTKGWQVWTKAMSSVSPAGALYYGDPGSKNINFGASAGTVLTPMMKVPTKGKSQLEFQIWWSHEYTWTYDRSYVWLWVDGKRTQLPSNSYPKYGSIWYAYMTGFKVQKEWNKFNFDVSAYAGKSVQLEFYFNSVDAATNLGSGILVDDIKLLQTCP